MVIVSDLEKFCKDSGCNFSISASKITISKKRAIVIYVTHSRIVEYRWDKYKSCYIRKSDRRLKHFLGTCPSQGEISALTPIDECDFDDIQFLIRHAKTEEKSNHKRYPIQDEVREFLSCNIVKVNSDIAKSESNLLACSIHDVVQIDKNGMTIEPQRDNEKCWFLVCCSGFRDSRRLHFLYDGEKYYVPLTKNTDRYRVSGDIEIMLSPADKELMDMAISLYVAERENDQ